MKKVCSSLLLALLLGGVGLSRHSLAQQPLLDVRLDCENTDYVLDPAPVPGGDPITCVVTVENVSGRDLLATQDFADYLQFSLRIGTPEGRQITARHLLPSHSRPNLPAFLDAATNTFVVGDPVETVARNSITSVPFNVRDFYTLRTAGLHTARAFVPVGLYETSSQIQGTSFARLEEKISEKTLISNTVNFTLIADADGDGWCFPQQHPLLCPDPKSQADCEDRPAGADGVLGNADDGANLHPGRAEIPNNGLDDDCNPNTPDFQLVNPGTLVVTATKHIVGLGKKPSLKKEPIANMHVRVFDKSVKSAKSPGSCVMQRFGDTWQHYAAVWASCPNVAQGRAFTDQTGTATMQVAAGKYIVVGQYDPDGSARESPPRLSGDEVYVARNVGELLPGAVRDKDLKLLVIVRADGSLVPAKYEIKTGSELLIIEPEYIEWDSAQEFYPFIFESIGDWQVTTSVTPPEGFVADVNSLTAEVQTETEAVQFTLTDVGTKWVDTQVTYEIEHKGKKEKVKSKVGVKLEKKLAKKKGLTELGEPLKKAEKK